MASLAIIHCVFVIAQVCQRKREREREARRKEGRKEGREEGRKGGGEEGRTGGCRGEEGCRENEERK